MQTMTRPALLLLFACLPLPLPAADAQDAAVRGAASCGEWVAQRKRADTLALANANWLIGYLSGLGAGSGRNILGGRDNAAVLSWMDRYCRAHPLKDVAAGGSALMEEAAGRKDGPR